MAADKHLAQSNFSANWETVLIRDSHAFLPGLSFSQALIEMNIGIGNLQLPHVKSPSPNKTMKTFLFRAAALYWPTGNVSIFDWEKMSHHKHEKLSLKLTFVFHFDKVSD